MTVKTIGKVALLAGLLATGSAFAQSAAGGATLGNSPAAGSSAGAVTAPSSVDEGRSSFGGNAMDGAYATPPGNQPNIAGGSSGGPAGPNSPGSAATSK